MADAVKLQYKVRENNEEYQDFLKDLHRWEDEVQAKDKLLVNSKTPADPSNPVRNKPQKKKPKSILKQTPGKPKLKGSDFQGWDKYDVDKALQEIDDKEEMETRSTDEDDSEDEEIIEHRRLQQALYEKEKGNDLFKEGKYEAAINRYTTAIELDPYNAILPANRAMALIKMQRYGAAIQDCDTALELNRTYVKAYARRATAKQSLGRLKEAKEDYEQLLILQPGNKQASDGIEKITNMLANQPQDDANNCEQGGLPKKPMKRYMIEEIGSSSSEDEGEENGFVKSGVSYLEDRSDLIQTLSHLSLSSQAPVNQASSIPIKTVGENTANSETTEYHKHVNKPASSEEHDTDKNDKDLHHRPAISMAGSAYISSTTIPSMTLTPPLTSIQFQSTWKCLEKNPELLCNYLKIIPADQLPKVIGESVESSFLVKIFTILRDFYIRDGHPVFNELKYISKVKRFSMTLMFLSEKEKSVINELFDHMEKLEENKKTFTDSELQALKMKYGLR